MKKILLHTLFLMPALLLAQAQQATLLGRWDDPTIVGSSAYNNRYNEVWSVAVNGHEYGIIGSTRGTHFIDVTDPAHPFEADYVPGKAQGAGIIHRDFKNYGNYVYAVCDEGPSSLQVMDVSTLPDSVRVVYDSDDIIVRAHNIFIDTAKANLYALVFGGNSPYGFAGMAILSLQDPENPTFVGKYNNVQGFSFGHIHDAYVRNDTAYLDAGNDGFCVADFSNPAQPKLLGSMTSYTGQGYNHSGWLSEDGRYYYMADENHGSPVKTVDVGDMEDIQVVDTYNAASSLTQIPHNPILACNYLYVAYYYDGLQVYDISDPVNVQRVLYYDTSTEPDGFSYKGAWGVNPFLPSGNILIADMQNGLFVFQGVGDNCISGQASGAKDLKDQHLGFELRPQPASTHFNLTLPEPLGADGAVLTIYDAGMRVVLMQEIKNETADISLPGSLGNGVYFLKVRTSSGTGVQKLVVQR